MAADLQALDRLIESWRDLTGGDDYGCREIRARTMAIDECADELEKALAALRAEAGAVGWMPIETAPADTTVLVYSDERCDQCPEHATGMNCARLDSGFWIVGKMQKSGTLIHASHAPTHWQPLPPRPSQKDSQP